VDFRVDFMIIGAMKAGTTDLAKKLSAHGKVDFCSQKEPHFFCRHPNWEEHLDQYHSLFQRDPYKISGEASTSHSFLGEYPSIVARLFEYNPELRFIYMARDPVARIRSHFAHRLMHGIADRDPERELSIRRAEYINRSQYGATLKAYQDFFGREQVLPIVFENYIRDPDGTLESVLDFLGLPGQRLNDVSARHSSTGSNRSRWSPVFYLDHILAFSPPAVRRVLSRWISVKLREKPQLPRDLALGLWEELEPDVALFERVSGLNVDVWRRRWNEMH